jgi:tRNA pseudouridine13 synthase
MPQLPAAISSIPYATADFLGCGGRLKSVPEDFLVDELPLYEASGTGEHLYVRLSKRGMSTHSALKRLSEATGVPLRNMGVAGQKDSQAVTTQWVSLHTQVDVPLQAAESESLRILETTRHGNKLRRGHLRGNRFIVHIRDAHQSPDWEELLNRCRSQGFPNLFGPQRFGAQGENAQAGRRLLSTLRGARRIRESARFEIHAFQAALFNALVARRLWEMTSVAQMLVGDLAVLHRNGASFPVAPETLTDTQTRADAAELSPSAPLFGCRIPLAGGMPGQWEHDLLDAAQLTLEDFRFGTKDASISGERRPVRAFPQELAWRNEPAGLILEFALGPGTYATALLRELMKTPELDTPAFAADSE